MSKAKENEQLEREALLERMRALLRASETTAPDDPRKWFIRILRRAPAHLKEHLWVAALARDLPSACKDLPPLEELVAAAKLDHSSPEELFRSPVLPSRPRRPIMMAALAAGLAAVVVTGFVLYSMKTAPPVAHNTKAESPVALTTVETSGGTFATPGGQQLRASFPDGSVVQLDGDTKAMLGFEGAMRVAGLERGQASFRIASDPQREFLLASDLVEITTHDAAFLVSVRDGRVRVTVIEGTVAVTPPSVFAIKPAETHKGITLGANQQVTISSEKWPTGPLAVDAKRESAWMRD